MKVITIRQLFLLMFLACMSLLGAAYYFEYVMYLEPCPLCVMQRIAVLLVGLVSLSGFILGLEGIKQKMHSVLLFVTASFGLFVAGRHIWIQSLPADQVPTCGPSLDYMVDTLPWAEVLTIMLRGNGNCAEAHWSFIGLSMPTWVLVWFVGFMIVSIILFVTGNKKSN
jgi:disulfide bond formation protein DsbB